mmetsp:Transcript_40023/g.66889  ORF Transcript_40023/g.66889 Transcript_40023/m.66889 type:complete len:497 (+) Transcript_40023:100-1590(+)
MMRRRTGKEKGGRKRERGKERRLDLGDVVRAALLFSSTSDAHELSVAAHLLDVVTTAVTDATAKAADELLDDADEGTAVRDNGLDTLRHEIKDVVLSGGALVLADVGTVSGHSAHDLALLSVLDEGLSWGLIGSGQEAAEHHGRSSSGNGLDNVSTRPDPSISNDWDVVLDGLRVAVEDGSQLGDSASRDDTGDANGARSDSDLDGIGTSVNQVASSLSRANVSGNDFDVGHSLLHLTKGVDGKIAVTMGNVEDDHVASSGNELLGPVDILILDTDGGSNEKTTLGVKGGIGTETGVGDVLGGDQTSEEETTGDVDVVNKGQLLKLLLGQKFLGLINRNTKGSNDELVLGSHVLGDGGVVLSKADVTGGDDTEKTVVGAALELDGLSDEDTADATLLHHGLEGGHGLRGPEDVRVLNDVALGTLDGLHHPHLVLHRQETVDDTDASVSGHGDGHLRLSDGVHVGGDDGVAQSDVACEAGLDGDETTRGDRGTLGDE